MREIEERHIMDAYAKWAKNTSFATANKALSLVSSFWDWCESYKYVDHKTFLHTEIKNGSRFALWGTYIEISNS